MRIIFFYLLFIFIYSCKGTPSSSYDVIDWFDKETNEVEIKDGCWTHQIIEYNNICFYIEDSIAVISPYIELTDGFQAIKANYYSDTVIVPSYVCYNGRSFPVRKIGANAFNGASNLNNVIISEGVEEIERFAFSCCAIKNISIPSTIKKIENDAFYLCEELKEIIISDENPTYKSILGLAVIIDKKDDRLLKAYNIDFIPSTINSISSGAFNKVHFDSLIIPANVKCIEQGAFFECSIDCIIVDMANIVFDTTPRLNCILEKSSGRLISACNGISILPENVREICNDAFRGVKLGDSVIFNDKLEIIGDRAFYGHNFKSIHIPAKVHKIGEKAFALGTSTTNNLMEKISVDPSNHHYISPKGSNVIIRKKDDALILGCNSSVLPDKIRSIEHGAFQACNILSSVRLPEGVEYVGDSAFLDCQRLTEIMFPNSLRSLGISAFQRCRLLSKVCLPSGLNKIGGFCFCSTAVDSIIIPQEITVIEDNTFAYTKMTNIIIPEGVKKIGKFAFSDTPLEKVILPNTLVVIAEAAFFDCAKLKIADLPSSLEYIGKMAFDCTAIEKVEFGNNLKVIGESAFASCHNIHYIRIPASVNEIGDCAFSGCSLDSLFVDEGNERYFSNDFNVIVDRNCNRIITGSASAFVPDGVNTIGRQAFYTIDIKHVQIPEGVTVIEESAFWGCSNASEILLPTTLRSIGRMAFCYCSSIKSINIPEVLNYIPQGAFLGCISLEGIVLPEGILSIGDFAFQGCTSLKTITIPSSVSYIGTRAFHDCWQLRHINNLSNMNINLSDNSEPSNNYKRSKAVNAILIETE